ncbi:endospore germination permease [Ornithinibacillus sp. L9]|uniref:Endospore germination permease n=1 Tax=Ornithinibacillus caprae TaxID=2678566 RepID=A0A6N8FL47_9BACI|nr:endospore germination permease [Ornithinibacillus caprae]MUK88018.1 endospore germination permease [Ornithinibacillus caprae]
MSTFKYGDEKITSREIMIAIPSMIIAVGILTFPRHLAELTVASDGWISIIIGGLIAILLTWLVAKIASNFPNQSFLSYASTLATRPVAIVLTCFYVIQGILITAFEVRAITDISHQFLFNETPVEIVGLTFLLVVVYAVSGTRAGLFRLNAMFLPIIFFTTLLLIIFSIAFMKGSNLLPVLKTDLQGHLQGTMKSTLSYTGIGILFFYISLVKNPKKAPSRAAFGMGLVVVVYSAIYLTTIAVFGETATANIRFPLIELSKTIEIPGGFFERLESIFFVIWIMAIFTTTAMALDIAVMALNSIFPNANKLKIIFLLSPIVFFISVLPQDFMDLGTFGDYVSYTGWGLTGTTAILLGILYKVKGAKKRGK